MIKHVHFHLTLTGRACLCLLTALVFLTFAQSQPDSQQVMRVACVGNSITKGVNLEYSKTYPSKLENLLDSNYQTKNFGSPGTCILKQGNKPYWDDRNLADIFRFDPHIIVIMLGTNDSKQINWVYKHDFFDDLGAMVDTFSTLSSNPRICLCLPPPAFSGNFGIRDSIIRNEVNPLIKQVSQKKNLPLADAYTLFENRPQYYIDDGIHLTDDGTSLLAELVYNVLKDYNPIIAMHRRHASAGSFISPKRLIALFQRQIRLRSGLRDFTVYSIMGQRICQIDQIAQQFYCLKKIRQNCINNNR